MKKILLLALFLICPLPKAHALNVELRDISGGQAAVQINFDASGGTVPYRAAGQYLKLDNAGGAQREVRIRADRAAGAFPLLSLGFSEVQPGVPAFSSDTEPAWESIEDSNSSSSNGLILKPNEVRYVYF